MNANQLSRRQFLQWTAGAASVAVLAACVAPAAPGAAPAAGGAAAPAAEGATIEFWSEIEKDWLEATLAKYKEENPSSNVELVSFKWGEMMPKVLTASAGGTAPNLIIQDRFRMAGWAGRGGAAPIDDYVTQYGVSPDAFWPATWAEGNWQDKLYSIPFNTDGRFIFWNKDLFSAAGLDPEQAPPTHDWEAMRDLAAQLTKSNSDGQVEQMGFVPFEKQGYGNGGDYVYAWSNGGEFMKDDRTAWLDNPKLVETLQWQKDVVDAVGGIQAAADFSAGWPSTAGFSPFGAGTLAMMVNGDWNLSQFKEYYPDLNFGMAPWHVRGSESDVTGFAGGFCLAVPAGGTSMEESYKLLNYMTSQPVQLDLGIQRQSIPALKEAALDEELINSSPYPELRRIANESMEYARFRPITPVGQEIQDLWTSPGTGRDWVLYDQKTPEQACADMQTQVQKALDEFWTSMGA
jgi:ABC-type glycerol-3-phosphate transport system substrate-binding protein